MVGALALVLLIDQSEGAHMIKVSVLYPNEAGTKFDITYYLSHHIPMVRRLLGSALKGVSVEHGISGEEPGSSAPYIITGHLVFDSVRWTPKSRPFFVDNKLMSGKVELCVFRSFSFEKGRSFQ